MKQENGGLHPDRWPESVAKLLARPQKLFGRRA
jgi:hypothetical protein